MKRVLLIGALLLGSIACRRNEQPKVVAPAEGSADSAFWKWFVANEAKVAEIKKGDEPITNELADELHKVDPGLTFEVGTGMTPRELIISADGDNKVFPAVKRLVAAAPKVPGWKVIAFRPRGSADFDIEVKGGAKLSAKDLSFRKTGAEHGKVDIVIYVANAKSATDSVKQAVFLLLDRIVGEYDVEMHIGGIDIEPGAPEGAFPFTDLPAVVDANKNTP